MDGISVGIKVKKTNVAAKTVSRKDEALRMDAERIAVSFLSGQYKYHFGQAQGLLESTSPYDIELTINVKGNRFVESHAYDIKEQIERSLKKRASVRIMDKKGKITVV